MALTREEILGLNDIEVKPIKVPQWGDKEVFIKQLTRGQADTYLKRQFGVAKFKADKGMKQNEISQMNVYGHDAYLCACGICDENGTPLFKQSDISALEAKNSEAIGFIAVEITKFSGLVEDAEAAKEAGEAEAEALEDVKNG